MVLMISLLALACLVWLAWPPRDEARWAFFAALGVAAGWLVFVGAQRVRWR